MTIVGSGKFKLALRNESFLKRREIMREEFGEKKILGRRLSVGEKKNCRSSSPKRVIGRG